MPTEVAPEFWIVEIQEIGDDSVFRDTKEARLIGFEAPQPTDRDTDHLDELFVTPGARPERQWHVADPEHVVGFVESSNRAQSFVRDRGTV